jgi:hypothetical protein
MDEENRTTERNEMDKGGTTEGRNVWTDTTEDAGTS